MALRALWAKIIVAAGHYYRLHKILRAGFLVTVITGRRPVITKGLCEAQSALRSNALDNKGQGPLLSYAVNPARKGFHVIVIGCSATYN